MSGHRESPDGPMRLVGCIVLITAVVVALGIMWVFSDRLGW